MLSESVRRKKEVFSICESSSDLNPGDEFKNIIWGDQSDGVLLPDCFRAICCGSVSSEEMLFRSEDGRYYFSIKDGWGKKEGVLYGIRKGFLFDFKHPTKTENIIEECERSKGSYSTWCGCMAYHYRKKVLDTICRVVENKTI